MKDIYPATYSATNSREMLKIADALSTASRLDVKSFKEAVKKQGELIAGIKADFEKLIIVINKDYGN